MSLLKWSVRMPNGHAVDQDRRGEPADAVHAGGAVVKPDFFDLVVTDAAAHAVFAPPTSPQRTTRSDCTPAASSLTVNPCTGINAGDVIAQALIVRDRHGAGVPPDAGKPVPLDGIDGRDWPLLTGAQ